MSDRVGKPASHTEKIGAKGTSDQSYSREVPTSDLDMRIAADGTWYHEGAPISPGFRYSRKVPSLDVWLPREVKSHLMWTLFVRELNTLATRMTPEQAADIGHVADAAVVGSALVSRIKSKLDAGGRPRPDLPDDVLGFVAELAQGVRGTRHQAGSAEDRQEPRST